MRRWGTAEAGSVLAGVLWLLVLMMLVAAVGARNSRIDGRVSLLSVEKTRCRWLDRAGVATATAALLADEQDTDNLSEDWSADAELLENVEMEGGSYNVKITDESSKLNVNTAGKEQLMLLEGMTDQIAESILDWRDRDDTERTYGAESGYYQNLTYGYNCRNGSFRTVRELLRVRGMTEELFYGQQDVRTIGQGGWSRFLTCYSGVNNVDGLGNERVNVNEANQNQLKSKLEINDSQAKWIVEHRPFKTFAELMDAKKKAGSAGRESGSSSTSAAGQDQNKSQSSGTKDSSSGSSESGTEKKQGSSKQRAQQGQQGQQSQQKAQQGQPLDWETFLRVLDKMTLSSQKFSQGTVNVNTAGAEVLETLLEGDETLALGIVKTRQQRGGVYSSLGELMETEGMSKERLARLADVLSVRSSVFSIKSEGISKVSGSRTYAEAVIRRQTGQPRILYWLEGAGI